MAESRRRISGPPGSSRLPHTHSYPSQLQNTSRYSSYQPISRTTPSPSLQLHLNTSERPPLVLRNNREVSPVEEEQEDTILGRLHGLVGLDQVVRGSHFAVHSCITYPFTIFQRQCQAFPYYSLSLRKSLPWHSLAVMHQMTLSQGMYSWWRGWQAQSMYLIGRPMVGAIVSRLIEPIKNKRTSKRTLWFKRKLTRFIVDGLTYTVCMPLISYILMESVQHTVEWTYASDYSGFKEFTLERPLLYPDPTSNRLSYTQLLAPTLVTSILSDLLLAGVAAPLIGRFVSKHQPVSVPSQIFKNLFSTVLSSFVTDLLLYPLLTVTIRLHCQGLPVLVANMESGSGVQFVKTFYSGPLDCIKGIWEAEGLTGFYKGLSGLLIQYIVQGILLLILWKGVVYWENYRRNRME